MDFQIKIAIIAIMVVIPLSSVAVWALDKPNLLQNDQDTKLLVFTTFFPLYEFSKIVGGSSTEVFLLVPAGVEPHEWEPSIREIEKIQTADVIIINGLGFEHWIHDIEFTNSNVKIVDTSKNFSTESSLLDSDNTKNPHIWLNPVFAKIQVQNIADGFSQIDPSNKKSYQQNADEYILKLGSLDSKIKKQLQNCKSDFITYHDAFYYFALQYGLNQYTIVKSNDHHFEPNPKNLEKLINLSKNLGIKVIFGEEYSNLNTVQIIANEIGGKISVLSTMEVMKPGDSYLGKMENNLEKLTEVLCN